MDDDLRGRPACHIKFGEANAVLAGDALLLKPLKPYTEGSSKQAAELAHAAGAGEVITGQVADLAAEHMTPSKN